MAKVAQLPPTDGAPDSPGASIHRIARPQTRYYAFLSYSHRDEAIAEWLQAELEQFKVPRALTGRLTANGVIPRRLSPIFRDEHELAAADDLGEEIEEALAASQFLIVLCSPEAATSRWTNAEIEAFKRVRPEGCVFAAIVSGEPFASEIPGREEEECFPPALRHKFDRRGRPTARRAEPLAADFRESGDGRRMGFLKLVAGMLGIGLDELVRREATRRHRRLAWLAAASVAGMAVTSTLAVTAIQSRDEARDQRRQAEGLVAFMLGDLKDKLEPIGKLDALDGVGARVLAYYRKQDTSQLSDAALSQRSQALSLMAEVANLRGDTAGATRLYREAMAGTAEAIRRNPDDPKRLFDHAQNVFYVGEIAEMQGEGATAESAMREYKRLAERMVALQPDNMKWRMEVQYANANLGIVLYNQRRFADAEVPLRQALRTIEGLATADPTNPDYQMNLPEALGWLADAEMSQGKLGEATTLREQQTSLLERLLSRTHNEAYYRLRLIKANQALGNLYAMTGRTGAAISRLQAALDDTNRLLAVEPQNTRSLEFAFKTRQSLAQILLAADNRGEASAQTGQACAIVSQLLARDNRAPVWRSGLRNCWVMRAQIALAGGAKGEALADAQRALPIAKSVKTVDPGNDDYLLASTYRLIGDIQGQFGNSAAAQEAWHSAFDALPKGIAERPSEIAEHATILRRLGQEHEAQRLSLELAKMSFNQSM